MAGLSDGGAGLALAMRSSGAINARNNSQLQELKSSLNGKSDSNKDFDDAEARAVANKFEALLIHNMLKSMRKTTMAEGTSNSRAIYDDMLDENLAEAMIESGGLGIADQIVAQIREQQGKTLSKDTPKGDSQRLLELAKHIQRPASNQLANKTNSATINASSKLDDNKAFKLVNELWSNNGAAKKTELRNFQQNFIDSLEPHAQRGAQRLGTSPNAIIAIAALETGWGRSMIKDENGKNSFNLFGIKAQASDNSYTTSLTTEYVNGRPLKQHADFKTFSNNADAVDGFADFILANPRYANALQHAGDSERFLDELQQAGYATDPDYADKAKSIMHQIAEN